MLRPDLALIWCHDGTPAMSTDDVRELLPAEPAAPAAPRDSALTTWLVARDILASAEGHSGDGETTLDRSVDVIRARNTMTRERVAGGQPPTAAALEALESDELLLLEEDERDHL
jgi:hypothetical protein